MIKYIKAEVKAKQRRPGDLAKVMDPPATGTAEGSPRLRN